MPILKKDACIGMRLIKILDCDTIHNIAEATEPHKSAETKVTLNDYVVKHYMDVSDGLGQIPGQYTIHTNPEIPPTVQPPRRIPVAL